MNIPTSAWMALGVVGLVQMMPRGAIRATVYDAAISPLTQRWYRAMLVRTPTRSHVLDVGIGTATALVVNADLLVARRIFVTGIDVDEDYVRRGRHRIERAGLGRRARICAQDLHDHASKGYDAIYFCASLMLMPDPAGALCHAGKLLAPGGRVILAQTFEHRRKPWMETMKPILREITTVEFGSMTYEDDFRATCGQAGMRVIEMTTLNESAERSGRVVQLAPRAAAPPASGFGLRASGSAAHRTRASGY